MALSKEQAEEIKKQLLIQVEQLPQENKEQIKQYIKGLNETQLEEFLKQNKIQTSGQESENQPSSEKPVFQSIVDGEFPSYKIAENDKAIAILEINPLSKAHSIILPKKQTTVEKIPKSAFSLAQKITKKIKKKMKPTDIKIETSSFQNYPMINIIPIYKDVQLKKQKADEKELEKLKNLLETKKRSPRATKTSKKSSKSNIPELRFRIP